MRVPACASLALLPVLAGCGGISPAADDAVPVTVIVAETASIVRTATVHCRLEPASEAIVTSIAPGRILEVRVAEGDSVHRGDVLMALSTDQQYRGAVAAASTGLSAARLAASSARADLARAERLRESGALGDADYERALAHREVSEAAARQAEARLIAERSLEESGTVHAPFAGTVTRVWVREGAVADGPLLSLAGPGLMTAELLLSGRHLPRLSNGLPVVFTTPHYPGELFPGELASVSPSIDPLSGLVPAGAVFLDVEERLRGGMTGTAVIGLETSDDVVVLPLRSLVRDGDGSLKAAVCRGGAARLVPLETGISSGTSIEVLSGVQPGDSVIDLGNHLVTDGSPVTVVRR